MPVFRVAPEMESVWALIERGIGRLSEGHLLTIVVTSAPRPLGLTVAQSATLSQGFRDVYAKIAADPAFANVPSVLGDAVSRDPARAGQYFFYRPVHVTAKTPVIVFLHGFGGNFQFYTWLLKTAFPNDVVVCPSYGTAWSDRGQVFLGEVIADVERRLNVGPTKPWLMGISAGGPAAFAIYNDEPDRFAGLVCIATCPDIRDVAKAKPELKVLMLNGIIDDRFPIEYVRHVRSQLLLRLPGLKIREIPNADHFFMLTMPDKTFSLIKDFIEPQP